MPCTFGVCTCAPFEEGIFRLWVCGLVAHPKYCHFAELRLRPLVNVSTRCNHLTFGQSYPSTITLCVYSGLAWGGGGAFVHST